MAAGHKDGTVVLWDDKGCKLLETKRQEYSITSITSDDGIILSRDGPEKNYVKGHTQTVRCLRWNADPAATHLFATGSDDKVVCDTMFHSNHFFANTEADTFTHGSR